MQEWPRNILIDGIRDEGGRDIFEVSESRLLCFGNELNIPVKGVFLGPRLADLEFYEA